MVGDFAFSEPYFKFALKMPVIYSVLHEDNILKGLYINNFYFGKGEKHTANFCPEFIMPTGP